MKVRIYKILKHTKVEGPGIRYCIWFQGCTRNCKGCFAQATHPKDGGKEFETDEILKDILSSKDIEGVTFLGGEPFEQSKALLFLAKGIHDAGLSVVCFTGNLIENIKNTEVLQYIDILIDGSFKENEKDFSRPWVGSRNQRYHFLSERYNAYILKKYQNKIEINIQKNGTLFINGMGNFNEITDNPDFLFFH